MERAIFTIEILTKQPVDRSTISFVLPKIEGIQFQPIQALNKLKEIELKSTPKKQFKVKQKQFTQKLLDLNGGAFGESFLFEVARDFLFNKLQNKFQNKKKRKKISLITLGIFFGTF